MKRILTAACGIFAITSFFAMADDEQSEHKTIESCVHLLPEGHSFTLSISGTIDTTKEQRELSGSFSITEDDGADGLLMKIRLRPFIKCVQPLIK